MTRTTAITLVSTAVLALIAIVITLVVLRDDSQETPVTITASPLEIQLTINGEDHGMVEDGTTLLIDAEDEIEVTAAYDGFDTYTATEQVTPGEESDLAIALEPQTEQAWELLDSQGQLEAEQRGTEQYLEEAEEAYANHPILHDLPEEQQHFRAAQGVSEDGENDWAIHLYLYDGHEDQGREDFHDWLDEEGYADEDYEIVEHIDNAAPPTVVPDAPSADELEAAAPGELPDEPTPDGLTSDELALEFAYVTTIWEPEADEYPNASLLRAENLMDDDLSEEITPEGGSSSPAWREAWENQAVSQPWVIDYSAKEADGDHHITMEVCWAWISDETAPVISGPRSYDLTITETDGDYLITDYSYRDPDPFVDASEGDCRLS